MTNGRASDTSKPAKSQRVQHREARLKLALKANMAKRKVQVRGRSDTGTDPVAPSDPVAGDPNEQE